MNNKIMTMALFAALLTMTMATTFIGVARADPTATVKSCYGTLSIRCAAHDFVNALKEAAGGATDSLSESDDK